MNIRSLAKNLEEVEMLLGSVQSLPDILSLTATWLIKETQTATSLINYRLVAFKSIHGIGSGVSIFASTRVVLGDVLETKDYEAVVIEAGSKSK